MQTAEFKLLRAQARWMKYYTRQKQRSCYENNQEPLPLRPQGQPMMKQYPMYPEAGWAVLQKMNLIY